MKVRINKIDRELLTRAVDIAAEGILKGGGPFGAVITKGGKIISEAYNEVVYSSDPTAHAEILVLRKAGKVLGNYRLKDTVLYVTAEPCPMCVSAMVHGRISRLVSTCTHGDAEWESSYHSRGDAHQPTRPAPCSATQIGFDSAAGGCFYH